jgi:hypothetical protein
MLRELFPPLGLLVLLMFADAAASQDIACQMLKNYCRDPDSTMCKSARIGHDLGAARNPKASTSEECLGSSRSGEHSGKHDSAPSRSRDSFLVNSDGDGAACLEIGSRLPDNVAVYYRGRVELRNRCSVPVDYSYCWDDSHADDWDHSTPQTCSVREVYASVGHPAIPARGRAALGVGLGRLHIFACKYPRLPVRTVEAERTRRAHNEPIPNEDLRCADAESEDRRLYLTPGSTFDPWARRWSSARSEP